MWLRDKDVRHCSGDCNVNLYLGITYHVTLTFTGFSTGAGQGSVTKRDKRAEKGVVRKRGGAAVSC